MANRQISCSDEEQRIKYAILQWIQFQPRKGFAWSQYNGGVYSPKLGRYLARSKYARDGVSDIIGIWCRKPLFIEVKRPGGKLSPEQIQFLAQANQHGAIAFVSASLQDAVNVLTTCAESF